MSDRTYCFERFKLKSASFAIRCLLVVAASLLSGAIPSFGLLGLIECEAPIDASVSYEVAFVGEHPRTQSRRHQPPVRHRVVVNRGLAVREVNTVIYAFPRGHRLPNHLLAPLRC